MSGGVGPCSDIGLTKEEERENAEKALQDHETNHPKAFTKTRTRRGFFSFRQLNALAVIVVLSASGMVSVEDLGFVVLSLVYLYFMSKVAFPILSPSREEEQQPLFAGKNKILTLYILAGATLGLFLPILYIFEGILEGDTEGMKAAAPHVFLLASQVFMEGVAFSDRFSLPIRVFVPVVYNSTRIYAIMEWLRSEMSKKEEEYGGTARRLYMGRVLALANMIFWTFNLFGFLLPFYLPMAFKRYYAAGYKG